MRLIMDKEERGTYCVEFSVKGNTIVERGLNYQDALASLRMFEVKFEKELDWQQYLDGKKNG